MPEHNQKIGLVIVDHGSRRSESTQVLLEIVEAIRGRDAFAFVVGAHMDIEQPSLTSAIQTCFSQDCDRVIVTPFFLAPGRHSSADIPRIIEEGFPGLLGQRILLAEPIGTHPGVLQAVMDRAMEIAGHAPQSSSLSAPQPLLLSPQHCTLLVIDLQGGLMPHIQNGEQIIAAASYLIKAARELQIPILLSEQYPKGLGPTDPRILALLPEGTKSAEKMCFGAIASDEYRARLPGGRQQLLVCGVESHVCVLQTALQAIEKCYQVFVVREAIGSRKAVDHEAALARMEKSGATLVSAEMAIYELLREAGTKSFKALLPMLKTGFQEDVSGGS